jgi:hypothetical protein
VSEWALFGNFLRLRFQPTTSIVSSLLVLLRISAAILMLSFFFQNSTVR